MSKKPAYSTVQKLSIDRIKTADDNPRTAVEDVELKELANSISVVGIIHPITVYLVDTKKKLYQIIAGERRYMATKMIGSKTIDARILINPTPEIISEIQIIENCQREGIHPLDECNAYSKLKWDAEEIALRIGKPVKYVNDRLNLALLSVYAKGLFRENKMSLGHALQLVKIKHTDQDKVLNEILLTTGRGEEKKVLGINTVWQLKNVIARKASVALTEAVFNKKSNKLYFEAGSCLTCTKRSGANKTLFNDVEEGDICFDPNCFAIKSMRHCIAQENELIKQGHQVIRLTSIYDSQFAEEYGLQSDFMLNITPVELHDKVETIGIYFEHPVKSKIGTIVSISNRVEEQAPAKTEQGEKALFAFRKTLMNAMGQRIGEFDCETIPLPIVKHLAINEFCQMEAQLQHEIAKFYKWKFPVVYTSDECKNILIAEMEEKSYQDVVQLLLTCYVYSFLQTAPMLAPEYKLISSLCLAWKIDLLAIADKVGKEHGVELNVLKKLL